MLVILNWPHTMHSFDFEITDPIYSLNCATGAITSNHTHFTCHWYGYRYYKMNRTSLGPVKRI